MHGGFIHHASGVLPPKSLVARGGLARTFGGLAGFVVFIFLAGGFYILQDALANPHHEGAPAVLCAALMLTLAAVLLFFLLKPPKRPRRLSRERSASAAVQAAQSSLIVARSAVREKSLRNNLAYQRMYVDHSCIRP